MTAHPVQPQRMIRHGGIQRRPGGQRRAVKQILVPAQPQHGAACGDLARRDKFRAAPGQLLLTAHAEKVNLVQQPPRVQHMEVGVVEAGHHGGAPQILGRDTGVPGLCGQLRPADAVNFAVPHP